MKIQVVEVVLVPFILRVYLGERGGHGERVVVDHVDGRFLRVVIVGHPLDYGLREERADRFLDAHRGSTLPGWEIVIVSSRLDVVEPVTETIVHRSFRLFLVGDVLVLVRVVGEVEQNYRRQNRHFVAHPIPSLRIDLLQNGVLQFHGVVQLGNGGGGGGGGGRLVFVRILVLVVVDGQRLPGDVGQRAAESNYERNLKVTEHV